MAQECVVERDERTARQNGCGPLSLSTTPPGVVNSERHEITPRTVIIDYTDSRGDRTERVVTPASIEFAGTSRTAKPQWLIRGFDHGYSKTRTFSISTIHSWKPAQ
jgi:hypothetical protein